MVGEGQGLCVRGASFGRAGVNAMWPCAAEPMVWLKREESVRIVVSHRVITYEVECGGLNVRGG